MKIRKRYYLLIILLGAGIIVHHAFQPVRNLLKQPPAWSGKIEVRSKPPVIDPAKKNVFIVADAKLTEMFDMLAPFYLFNATGMSNVFIVAKDRTPILIKKDLFVCPQLTFGEADSMRLKADVIVIPALSARDEHQDTVITGWIKDHFSNNTKMLTICDGATTGAATGLYDGKPITCHASDIAGIKKHFKKPIWVQNVSVARSGNLFSTAGVSNAAEGSLVVIKELFGPKIMDKVVTDIHYPDNDVVLKHESVALSGSNIFTALRKVSFGKNRDIGLLLEHGMNEFVLAAFLDTYNRTLPGSFKTYILEGNTIHTKNGLTLVNTSGPVDDNLEELHLLMPEEFSMKEQSYFKDVRIINHRELLKEYPFDAFLSRIGDQYGHSFAKFVRVSLDYNERSQKQ